MTDSLHIAVIFLWILVVGYALLLFRLRRGFSRLPKPRNAKLPTVTIVVSMHNEEKNVRDLVAALIAQDYPQEKLEIIIVNDRSTDSTGEILARLSRKYPWLKVITIRDQLPDFAPKKRAIDVAAWQARGEIILHTDADGRPGPLWVKSLVSHFEEKVGMVIGYAPYRTTPPFNKWIHRVLALEYFSHAAIAAASTGLGYPATCVGTNLGYRKSLYLQLDGFGPFRKYLSGDDDLFLQRVREETDWEIRYAFQKEAQVFNNPPSSFRKFYQQRIRYTSKSYLYPSSITFALGGVYLLNLLLFFLIPYQLLTGKWILGGILALICKGGVEFSFLKKATRTLNENRSLSIFPLAHILHIPYVVYFGVAGLVLNYEWGARESSRPVLNEWVARPEWSDKGSIKKFPHNDHS